jgi:hypothetical protein
MDWFCTYLLSVIAIPTIFWSVYVGITGESIEIKHGADVLPMVIVHCLLWPLSASLIAFMRIKEYRKNRRERMIADITKKLNGVSHDRSALVDMPEGELKFIARMYREKKALITPTQFEMVRDELMSRNAERHLLM